MLSEDDLLREALDALLTLSGWTVVTTRSAAEALQRFDPGQPFGDSPPDVICLDLLRPLDQEFAFLDAYRQATWQRVPIVALSGMPGDATLAADAGVTAVVAKPFDARQCLDVLEQAARRGASARRGGSPPAGGAPPAED